MKLSVIIPFYNQLDDVLTCLNSLQALAHNQHEYIVQDDASPNVFAPAVIPSSVASVQRNERNLGFAANVNAAARRATGDVLFIVNQDVYGVHQLSGGWDVPLLNFISVNSMGVISPRLLFPDGRVQSVGGLFDAHGQPFHRCLGWSNLSHPDVSELRAVSWTTGAAMMIRRDVWDAVGGFDEAYGRGYFEDVELCLKVRALGKNICFVPNATLVHKVGTTGGNPDFMRNAQLFKSRWIDTGKVTPDEVAIRERWW